jgi:hypothetical protein
MTNSFRRPVEHEITEVGIRVAHAHEAERIGPGRQHFESALTYARDKNLERHAVADERELIRDAQLGRSARLTVL